MHRLQARRDGTTGQPLGHYLTLLPSPASSPSRREGGHRGSRRSMGRRSENPHPGIKKRRPGKPGQEEMPPTPWGCEWRRSDDGWNLWRCWSEKDGQLSRRVKKSRYAGYLSNEAWAVLKDYDYETFLSIIGQRLRRYGKR